MALSLSALMLSHQSHVFPGEHRSGPEHEKVLLEMLSVAEGRQACLGVKVDVWEGDFGDLSVILAVKPVVMTEDTCNETTSNIHPRTACNFSSGTFADFLCWCTVKHMYKAFFNS